MNQSAALDLLAVYVSYDAIQSLTSREAPQRSVAGILLCGLVLNASLGWWWADPVSALAMVPIIAKEGSDALRGRTCCAAC